MLPIDKFAALATDNAPGQEVRQVTGNIGNSIRGESIEGRLVDFSHGDVDAFLPAPGALEEFSEAVAAGGRQATRNIVAQPTFASNSPKSLPHSPARPFRPSTGQ
jgi:hypothetical protein